MKAEHTSDEVSRNIVVIGGSAGAFNSIKQIIAGLPPNFNAAIFVVWHMGEDVIGILPEKLAQLGTMPVAETYDNEPIQLNRVYVAPNDDHLIIEGWRIRITRGPKENRFRPAIDPLFRSAAFSHGSRVIGIVLSGGLDDGSAGLWTIKKNRGTAIVQDPKEAEVRSMPESALRRVLVDFKVSISEIPDLLIRLCGVPIVQSNSPDENEVLKNRMEVNSSLLKPDAKNGLALGELSPYTCPDCHGVLTMIKEGDQVRFRCHTGHVLSADSLLYAITENVELELWNTIRNMQESVMLLNQLGDHYADHNEPHMAALYFQKAREADERAAAVTRIANGHEILKKSELDRAKF